MEKICTTCLNSKWGPIYAILMTFIAYSVIKKYDIYDIAKSSNKIGEIREVLNLMMEKYEEVYWKTIEYAKETAREAGLKEGQVLAFLKMNLPITEIIKHTGLSEEEIQKIKNTL